MYTLLLLFACILFIILATTKLSLHPFLALFTAAVAFGVLSGMPFDTIIESINGGFGNTMSSVGIIIILGTIIGVFLENSGGAYAIADRLLKITGDRHVPFAMGAIGWFVSIAVFADSGFVILYPLTRALSKKAAIPLAVSVIALGLGLTASHCLVPPTPGPIAGAGIIGADLGLVIMLGIPLSLVTLAVGMAFALTYARRFHLEGEPADCGPSATPPQADAPPPAIRAFLPILVPIILIVLKSVSDLPSLPLGEGFVSDLFGFVGSPVIALFIGVLFAFTLPRKFDLKLLSVSGWVGKGLLNAALILMITGAGGAFGRILQNSGIADIIGGTLSTTHLGILLPFILASAIKTSQGSSTVSIIMTASLLAPLLQPLGLDSSMGRALAVLAIGAGSMNFSHANDSFFWILTQMTGMTVKTGYLLWSLGTCIIGFSTAGTIWIMSLFML